MIAQYLTWQSLCTRTRDRYPQSPSTSPCNQPTPPVSAQSAWIIRENSNIIVLHQILLINRQRDRNIVIQIDIQNLRTLPCDCSEAKLYSLGEGEVDLRRQRKRSFCFHAVRYSLCIHFPAGKKTKLPTIRYHCICFLTLSKQA